MGTITRVGLIVPPAKGHVPPDARLMYPDVDFLIAGIGVTELSGAGYAEAVDRVADLSRDLAGQGAEALLIFGTSLSFFRGIDYNDQLEADMRAVSGLPAQTLTSAMVAGVERIGARKLAVATAYGDEVNAMFAQYFTAAGFDLGPICGLDMTALADVETVDETQICALARAACAACPDADALVLSCAGFTTARVAPALEAELGLPVVSSAMVGAYAAVKLAGGAAALTGYGRLYAP